MTNDLEKKVRPDYYKKQGLQLIDVWRAKYSPAEFEGMCKIHISKYIYRAEYKNGLEDYKKALYYLDELISYETKLHPELQEAENQNVKHPSHYEQGGMQILDVWKTFYTTEEFIGFARSNTDKYVMRAGKKDPQKVLEDLGKARVYLTWIIEAKEKERKK